MDEVAGSLDVLVAAVATAVGRGQRIGADHPYPLTGDLFQVTTGAADGPAGADGRHQMGDPTLGVGPDLRSGGVQMGLRIGLVVVLAGEPRTRRLRHVPFGMGAQAVGMIPGDEVVDQPQLRTVGGDLAPLLDRDGRAGEDHRPVAQLCCEQRESDPSVAAGQFDHGPAGPQQPVGLGLPDHGQGCSVLAAAAGVPPFGFHVNGRWQVPAGPVQPDQRGTTDCVGQGFVPDRCWCCARSGTGPEVDHRRRRRDSRASSPRSPPRPGRSAGRRTAPRCHPAGR